MVLGVNVAAQTLLFFRSIALGACLMLVYDVFRILRQAFKMPSMLVAVQDFLFCAICAVTSFVFMVSANYGEIRFFTLLGEGIGAILCYFTLSRVVMACSLLIIAAVKTILIGVWRIFLRPVYRLIYSIALLFIRAMERLGFLFKKSCQKANYGLKRRRLLLYNLTISKRHRKNEPGQKERKLSRQRGKGKRKQMEEESESG